MFSTRELFVVFLLCLPVFSAHDGPEVSIERPIIPGQKGFLDCGESFSLLNTVLSRRYYRASHTGALVRRAAALADGDTSFAFECVSNQEPGTLRYGDTVRLVVKGGAFDGQALTSLRERGTLVFAKCSACELVVSNPVDLDDTNGPIKNIFSLSRKADGAYLTVVKANDEDVIFMRGERDSFASFEAVSQRSADSIGPATPDDNGAAEAAKRKAAAEAAEAKRKADLAEKVERDRVEAEKLAVAAQKEKKEKEEQQEREKKAAAEKAEAARIKNQEPAFCAELCGDGTACGFSCRTSCPSLCAKTKYAPADLCTAQCKGKCGTPACKEFCPNVCPPEPVIEK